MAIVVIKRMGFKADSGAFQAKALEALAGQDNVKITLRGPWRLTQSNIVVDTPCFARVYSNEVCVGDDDDGWYSARPERGATMDIVARVERVVENA